MIRAVGCCSLTVFVLAACGREAPTQRDKVEVVMSARISSAPFGIAEDKGYFTEEGIDVHLVPTERSSAVLPAFFQGKADVWSGTPNFGLFEALTRVPDAKVVASKGYYPRDAECHDTALVVREELLANDALERAETLKTLTFDTNPSSSSGYLTDRSLEPFGLTLDDVKLADIPEEAAGEALAKDRIDVTLTQEPWVTRAENRGQGKIWKGGGELAPGFDWGVMAYSKRLLRDDPDLGQRFMNAYLKGVAEYQKGKTADNVRIIAKLTGVGEDVVREGCWPTFRKDGRLTWSGVDAYQRWGLKRKELDKPITEDDFWTTQFVDAADVKG